MRPSLVPTQGRKGEANSTGARVAEKKLSELLGRTGSSKVATPCYYSSPGYCILRGEERKTPISEIN